MRKEVLKFSRTILALSISLSLASAPAHAARTTDGATATASVSRIGVLIQSTADGQVQALCEFPAHGNAPAFVKTGSGPSSLPPFELSACSSEQMKLVRRITVHAHTSETASALAVIPAALCLISGGAGAYLSYRGAPYSAGSAIGGITGWLSARLGVGAAPLGKLWVCGLMGEGLQMTYQFLVTYFSDANP